jgi:hypothetical protein
MTAISRTVHTPGIPGEHLLGVGTKVAGLIDLAPAERNKILALLSSGATITNIRLPASTLGIEHGHAAILIESNQGRMLIGVFPKGFPPGAQVMMDTDIDSTLNRGKRQSSVQVQADDGRRLADAFDRVLELYMRQDLTPYYPANTCFTFADALMVAARGAKSN